VKFWVDANLPPRLARWLTGLGHPSIHAFDLEMARSPDEGAWALARSSDTVVISKDEDFARLVIRDDSQGPRLDWIRLGNLPSRILIEKLAARLDAILALLESGETLVVAAD
jgi:predicted nuclease of predicted toxin-antitoxin system